MSQLDYSRFPRPRAEGDDSIARYRRSRSDSVRRSRHCSKVNVGYAERLASLAAGTALAALGLSRKSVPGLILAGIGGGLAYRGASGHCGVYERLGVDTTDQREPKLRRGPHPARHGIHVVESILINKPATELYDLWRNFENLPRIMSHLKSVRVIDDRRSHWIVEAPRLLGGRLEWEAEIIRDEPHSRIAWRSLPDSQIDQRGMVSFLQAPGDRGVIVRVDVEYRPPAGQVGYWLAKLLGEDPAQQIRDDLRNLKRSLEIGEVITVQGQPRGSCFAPSNGRR